MALVQAAEEANIAKIILLVEVETEFLYLDTFLHNAIF
jgi:hypothetical protein